LNLARLGAWHVLAVQQQIFFQQAGYFVSYFIYLAYNPLKNCAGSVLVYSNATPLLGEYSPA
jgi:hypothetical protein